MFVLGNPVQYSLSPVMQQAAFDFHEIDCDYYTLELKCVSLADFRAVIESFPVPGFNITAPYKQSIARVCDSLTEEATSSGNVNCVKVVNNKWVGHNTDIGGIKKVISNLVHDDVVHGGMDVVILGTGSAARSALIAVDNFEFNSVEVRYHTSQSADEFNDWHRKVDVQCAITMHDLAESISVTDKLLVNCLSDVCLKKILNLNGCTLLDLNYSQNSQYPAEVSYVPGTALLLEQGALAFDWWFSKPAPFDIMTKALLDNLPE
jgi:shikimate dehydrogenase